MIRSRLVLCKSKSAWRKLDRRDQSERRGSAKEAGTAARIAARGHHNRRPHQAFRASHYREFLSSLQAAAPGLRMQLHVLRAGTDGDLDTVFADLGQLRADALVICPYLFFNSRMEQLAKRGPSTSILHHARRIVPTYNLNIYSRLGHLVL